MSHSDGFWAGGDVEYVRALEEEFERRAADLRTRIEAAPNEGEKIALRRQLEEAEADLARKLRKAEKSWF